MRFMFVLGLGMLIAGCRPGSARNYELGPKTFTVENFKMVEQQIGITLPTNSVGLNMLYKGFKIDPWFLAKIKVPISSKEALARQITQIPDEGGRVLTSLTDTVKWWTPDKDKILIDRRYDHDEDFVHLLLCEENGECLLYVEWIST